ncbi:hypothetical protein BKE38_22985 [Pseudoroseomonas deserti]|uniref:Tryptophan-rich sensory protein n=1 Tax=Teichococcus deserti TaxID=1817963 RepID=A0A1V2GWG9_9PROT|nr:hypothetical protein [Pseudoroseomonas deserti]ONG47573.1 hypothetical protein BKE38_22985 [Pseudoroseomonas deserti]
MTRNDLRTLLNIALPLAQPLVGAMASVFGIGHTQAEMSARSQTPVVPAGYAFSIWGLLFALSIAWGIWQLLPSAGRDSLVARRLGWPLAATFAGSILWMVLSQLTENGWHLVAVMLLVLSASLTAFFVNRRAEHGLAATQAERWLIRPLVGLLAGWVSVATFANIAGAALVSGFFPNQGAGLTVAAVLILLACGGLVLTVLWIARGSPWYAAAVAWALVAILYANTAGRDFNLGVAITAGALLAVVLAMAWQRARRPLQAQFR